MSIIEKLGIKSEYIVSMINGGAVVRLEKQRNEMLEALIKTYNNRGEADKMYLNVSRFRIIIEKACYPKKWEEIKQLLADNK